jgi:hypothetical protein
MEALKGNGSLILIGIVVSVFVVAMFVLHGMSVWAVHKSTDPEIKTWHKNVLWGIFFFLILNALLRGALQAYLFRLGAGINQ